jgi:hemerythrin-like domain-containing protein
MNPIEILKQEHRVIEQVLRALEGICLSLDHDEQVPPEVLAQCLNFLREFADRSHHGKEETHLFPALEQRGVPRQGGPIGVMLYEHTQGRQLIAQLATAVQAYKSGEPRAGGQIIEAARDYISLLTLHIHKEDNILFPIAEDILDEKAVTALAEAFQLVEQQIGVDALQELEQIASDLERDWASGSQIRVSPGH